MIKKAIFLITLLVLLLSFGRICYAEGLYLRSNAECSPYPIYQQSEGVTYTVSGADSGWYTTTDYFGNAVYSGEFSNGELVISDVETGHYELTVTDGNGAFATTEFAVVPDLDERRDSTYNPLAFSAMTTTTYTTNNVPNYDAYAKTITLAGVNYVREYIDWTCLMTNTQHLTKNKAMLEAYNNNNIGVMYMIQKMPGSRTVDNEYYENGNHITYDLNNAYNAVRKILEVYPDQIDTIEFLNEPDLLTEKDTADRYASLLKVASIAAEDINKNVRISNAGITFPGNVFTRRLLQNDINDYIDIYNTHQYRDYNPGASYVETQDEIENFMGDALAYGMSNKKLWMGEYGFRAKYNDGEADLSKEQLLQAARSAPIALIRANKTGVDRLFWFIHGYLKEGVNGFGTLTTNHAPTYVYSALSAFTNALGNAGYSREIEADDVNICIYADGTEEIACVWAENEKTITLPANNGQVIITDIMGKEIQETVTDNFIEITVGPDIQYIRAYNGFSDASEEAIKYKKEATRRPELTKAQKVVMTPGFEEGADVNAANWAYTLSIADGETNQVKLNVYNFNDTAVTARVECVSEGGWTIDSPVQTVTIPAKTEMGDKVEGGLSTLTFNISANETANVYDITSLMFSATVDGEKSSDMVTNITSEDVKATPLSGSKNAWTLAPAGAENNAASSELVSGTDSLTMKCSFLDTEESKVCRMTYGNFLTEFKIDENSAGISFKCTSEQQPDVTLRVWVTDSDSDTFYGAFDTKLKAAADSGGKNHPYAFPFEYLRWAYGSGNKTLDVGNTTIMIGIMNPSVNNVDFCFSDFGHMQKVTTQTKKITVNGISYADGKITATLSSADAKNVRFMVLGSVYDASVAGNMASANALLPRGEHNVDVFAFDVANRVHKGSGTITVAESDIPSFEVQEEKNGAVVDATGYVTVNGTVSSGYAGKNAAVIVYPDTIMAEDVTLSDMVYFDQVAIGNGGKYSFTFNIKDYNSNNGYIYALSVDGVPIRSQIGEYALTYEWSGVKIEFFRTEKTVKMVSAMNYASEEMNLITGMYKDDGKLIEAFCETLLPSEYTQKSEAQYSIPKDAHILKAFVWSADGSLTPLQLPTINYFKER